MPDSVLANNTYLNTSNLTHLTTDRTRCMYVQRRIDLTTYEIRDTDEYT